MRENEAPNGPSDKGGFGRDRDRVKEWNWPRTARIQECPCEQSDDVVVFEGVDNGRGEKQGEGKTDRVLLTLGMHLRHPC